MPLFKNVTQKLSFYNKLHKISLYGLGAFSLLATYVFCTSIGGFIYNFSSWQKMQKMKETLAAEIMKEDQEKAELEFEKLLVIPEKFAYLVEEHHRKVAAAADHDMESDAKKQADDYLHHAEKV